MLMNRVVVISGGGTGIGLACVKVLLENNATVITFSRSINPMIFEELEKIFPNRLHILKCDISNHSQVKKLIQEIIQSFKRIDILINNASIIDDNFIKDMRDEQWEKVININLNGTFYCLREVIPYMINQNFGRIVNISSVASKRGTIAQSNYAASKAAIDSLTRSLAKELGKFNITTNSVVPGIIRTNMIQNIPKKILEKNLELIPLKRFGTPDEVAKVVLFLVSDNSSYCNGCFLNVDGGLSI